MLQKGFIVPCTPCEDQIISPIFTVPKPNGKHRFILNLKELNKYIEVDHFKMEDYRTALKLLDFNYFMATLDLKDAYFLINVDESHRKVLRFEWDSKAWPNKLFEFTVLPFGLTTAPYVFTKLLKPVLQTLRSSGYLSVVYLDDFFCIGTTYKECLMNVSTTKALLTKLGFIINNEKSNIIPNKICKFLGFIFDTNQMKLFLPEDKKVRIKNKVNKFLKLNKCTIRQFAEFIGLLTSACPAVRYGWVYTKLFEREKFLALNYTNNYNRQMMLPSYLKQDLLWWKTHIDTSYRTFRNDNYCIEIFSDASSTGWGAACNDDTASGHWSTTEITMHINTLELKAALYGLKIFAKNLTDCDILLRIDNTTAIAYINRMGGVQFPHLNGLSREIWQWCEVRNIFIFASYIKSSDNVIADRESRQTNFDTEWELAEYAFLDITYTFGTPEFDLFATVQNHKCDRYASWKLDPYSEVIDAFTFNWRNLRFYAFPPFCLIAKVLQKILHDRAEGVIVVPYWPSQPWYPLYCKLRISNEIIFQPDKNLLISPFREAHPLHADLTLVAAKLSGNLC